MRRKFKYLMIFVLLWGISINTNSQDSYIPNDSPRYLSAWLDQIPANQSQATLHFLMELDEFVDNLRKRQPRYKDQSRFLAYVYYKTHRKYLRQYETPSTLVDLVNDGKYDCITGSALYGMILDKLGVPYNIVETTYHVYLTLELDGNLVLVETTNPLNGFIMDQKMIEGTLESYQQDRAGEAWNSRDYYKPNHQVNNQIDLTKLAGLQYFNQATEAYNQKHLNVALINLDRALEYYPSTRLKEMMVLMINSLEKDPLIDPGFKHHYISKYGHLRHSIITAQIEK